MLRLGVRIFQRNGGDERGVSRNETLSRLPARFVVAMINPPTDSHRPPRPGETDMFPPPAPSALLALLLAAGPLAAADKTPVQEALAREIIGPRLALSEVQDYLDPKVPRLPEGLTRAAWEKQAQRLRQEVLDRVVFRGAA